MQTALRSLTFWAVAMSASATPLMAQTATPAIGATEPASSETVPEVLDSSEAARFLKVNDRILIDLAITGRVPARKIGSEWRFSRMALLRWLAGDQPQFATGALSAHESAALAGRGMGAASAQQTEPVVTGETIGAAPKDRTASEVFLRDQRVLLRSNEFALDFGLFYSRSDNIVLIDADAVPSLANVESDSFGGSPVGRYSIGRDTELFASTTYRKQKVSVIAGGDPFSRASRSDLGDIRLGARRTVLHEDVGRPDVILTVEGTIPTGASSFGLGGGVTLVKSFDPAVLFGSIDYRHSFSRDFADTTRLQPRDRIDAMLGYAFALNDTLILNTGVSGSFSLASSFSEARLRQTDTYNLLLGMTARLSRRLFVQPSVTYRLNGPGNAVIFGLNFPYSFGF